MLASLYRLRKRLPFVDGIMAGLAAPTFVFWPVRHPPLRPMRVEDAWRRVGRSFDSVMTDPEGERERDDRHRPAA